MENDLIFGITWIQPYRCSFFKRVHIHTSILLYQAEKRTKQ